jgi:hypothetical protein
MTQRADQGQDGRAWTVILRRRPARIKAGGAANGYDGEFEIVCCHCGDDPDLDYRQVPSELQRIRGPYPMAAGITEFLKHTEWHPGA